MHGVDAVLRLDVEADVEHLRVAGVWSLHQEDRHAAAVLEGHHAHVVILEQVAVTEVLLQEATGLDDVPPSRCSGGTEYVILLGCVSIPAGMTVGMANGVAVAAAVSWAIVVLQVVFG